MAKKKSKNKAKYFVLEGPNFTFPFFLFFFFNFYIYPYFGTMAYPGLPPSVTSFSVSLSPLSSIFSLLFSLLHLALTFSVSSISSLSFFLFRFFSSRPFSSAKPELENRESVRDQEREAERELSERGSDEQISETSNRYGFFGSSYWVRQKVNPFPLNG